MASTVRFFNYPPSLIQCSVYPPSLIQCTMQGMQYALTLTVITVIKSQNTYTYCTNKVQHCKGYAILYKKTRNKGYWNVMTLGKVRYDVRSRIIESWPTFLLQLDHLRNPKREFTQLAVLSLSYSSYCNCVTYTTYTRTYLCSSGSAMLQYCILHNWLWLILRNTTVYSNSPLAYNMYTGHSADSLLLYPTGDSPCCVQQLTHPAGSNSWLTLLYPTADSSCFIQQLTHPALSNSLLILLFQTTDSPFCVQQLTHPSVSNSWLTLLCPTADSPCFIQQLTHPAVSNNWLTVLCPRAESHWLTMHCPRDDSPPMSKSSSLTNPAVSKSWLTD